MWAPGVQARTNAVIWALSPTEAFAVDDTGALLHTVTAGR